MVHINDIPIGEHISEISLAVGGLVAPGTVVWSYSGDNQGRKLVFHYVYGVTSRIIKIEQGIFSGIVESPIVTIDNDTIFSIEDMNVMVCSTVIFRCIFEIWHEDTDKPELSDFDPTRYIPKEISRA